MPVGYGKSVRKAVAEARQKAKLRYLCPSCSRRAVKRMSNGVWLCAKCNAKYASGAYEFGG